MSKAKPLAAPFPFYGGKRNFAKIVWERFGEVTRYIEPFAGSLAVLLRNPQDPLPRGGEVVCDKSPFIPNFWRAVKCDPAAVAWWADYPTIHHDLRARHKWLLEWARANRARVWDDPNYYNPQAAGWWAWGMSSWVGAGFCMGADAPDRVPHLHDTPGGLGVQTQRLTLPDKRPHIKEHPGGPGVQMQRIDVPDGRPFLQGHPGGLGVSMARTDLEDGAVRDTRPSVFSHPGGQGVQTQNLSLPDVVPHVESRPGGQGVQAQRLTLPDKRPYVCDTGHGQGCQMAVRGADESEDYPLNGSRLQPWMLELCRRLKRTVVLHRDWRSAVTNKMLMREKGRSWVVGVFLDPPYIVSEGNRSKTIYQSDLDGTSDDAARDSYAWAVEHGETERFRIAFCCRHGDFPLPDGWTSSIKEFPGVTDPERRKRHKDEIMFSPHCLPDGDGGPRLL